MTWSIGHTSNPISATGVGQLQCKSKDRIPTTTTSPATAAPPSTSVRFPSTAMR
ncbi:MAG: hypothetical protein ACXVXL_27650 [Solirubrobacteraceae bacterium]